MAGMSEDLNMCIIYRSEILVVSNLYSVLYMQYVATMYACMVNKPVCEPTDEPVAVSGPSESSVAPRTLLGVLKPAAKVF